MKKVDIHVSLEGSLSIPYVNKLMNTETRNVLIKKDALDMAEYLSSYQLPVRLLQSRENLLDFTKLLVQDLLWDDVIYAEIHFCPYHYTSIMTPEEVMETVIEGIDNPEIKIKLVLEMPREYTLDKNLAIVRLAKTYSDYVGGLSLIGDETLYKTATFRQLFEVIKIDNIPFAIDAIEPDSIRYAVEFGAQRIENGIKAIENPELMELIASNNAFIELAPSCNIDSKLCIDIKEYPIEKYRKSNVKTYISVYNRTSSNTTLNEEYKLLKEKYKYLNKDLLEFNLNGIEAAFLGKSEKAELISKINKTGSTN